MEIGVASEDTMSEQEDLLSFPDAVLLRPKSIKEVDERLGPFTVPLTFLDGEGDKERPTGNGSGVLVRIQERRFLLTAGHVLRQLSDAKTCAIGIRRERHRFAPRHLGRVEYRLSDGNEDYGFIEFDASVWPSIEAAQKIFAGPNRLLVETADALRASNDWFVMAGFPDEVTVQIGQGTGYRLVHASTTIAGQGVAPSSTLPPPHIEALDLWLNATEKGYLVTGELARDDVPPFAGASGGGMWKGGVRPISKDKEWSGDQLRLAGIYIGSTAPSAIDGMKVSFYRSVLLGHHLSLIASTTPNVRDELLKRWPILEDVRWGK